MPLINSEYDDRIADLEDTVDWLQTRNSTLDNEISNLEDELAALQLRYKNLFNHVKSHANCCSDGANTEFAENVASGRVK